MLFIEEVKQCILGSHLPHVYEVLERIQAMQSVSTLSVLLLERARLHSTNRSWSPDGWTIGINDGYVAGQSVDHFLVHIIPRTLGDVPDSRGGIRRMFAHDIYSLIGDC